MQSTPLLAAIDAAQRAVTTALISYSKVFDFSRLTLLKLRVKLDHISYTGEATSEIIPGAAQEVGQIYVVRVNWPNAKFEFEILDRQRGLKASLLHNLHSSINRPPQDAKRKELRIQDLTQENSAVLSLIACLAPDMCTSVQGEFGFYGSLDPSANAELVLGPQIAEIVQSDVLIAQFKQNTVL